MSGKLGPIDVLLIVILDGFDILAVLETWESIFNEQLINIPISSITKIGGNVAMFVKQTLNISQHINFSVTTFESLFIEISNKQRRSSTIIGVIYRPPNPDLSVFNNEFENVINP